MKLTNKQIYDYADQLTQFFSDTNQKLPIKINFYLQKNKSLLLELAQQIERARLKIAEDNGVLDEESKVYRVPAERAEETAKEIEDLFNLEQEVTICMINIDNLSDDLMLTTGQMEALMFMIE